MIELNNCGWPACTMPWAIGMTTDMKFCMFSVRVAMFGFLAEPASTR